MSNAYRELKAILEKLESDKIKDRGDGVSRFRDLISSSRSLNSLSTDNSHSWLKTLQSLFHLVITERNAFAAKANAPAQKRLEEATQLVALTLQKCHLWLNRKALKAVFSHLTQMIAIGGKLQHYALVYLRSLKALLSYRAHLEHLDEKMWTDMVSLCFAGVLGDKIKVGQEFKDDEAMDVDDSEEDEEEDDGKRANRGPLRATPADDHPLASTSSARRSATQEEIEFLSCISTLFLAHSAPFITFSRVILHKFLRFFRQFPTETTAHVAALTALNRAFSELELNDQKVMKEEGLLLWSHVLELWATKNAALKEQVVMGLKYLWPFVKMAGEDDTRIRPLFDAVLTEPTIRWREAFELNIDGLALGISEEDARAGAFKGKTFGMGIEFTEKHAVAWTVLELGADSLFRLYQLAEGHHPAKDVGVGEDGDEGTPGPGRNKRRKIEEPLEAFINSLSQQTTAQTTSFRLSLLLFLVERHWTSLHTSIQHHLLSSIVPLLSSDDLSVQTWSFLITASSAFGGLSSPPISSSSSTTPIWDQVFTISLRRLSNPLVSRAAAHSTNTLLALSLVSQPLLSPNITSFAKDLDIQGPSFPSDSVCKLLEWFVALSASDVHLLHLRFPEKVFSWLSGWKVLDGVVRNHSIGMLRPRGDGFYAEGVRRLVGRICGIKDVPGGGEIAVVPDCAVGSMKIQRSETEKLRSYVEGVVPEYERNPKKEKGKEKARIRTPDDVGFVHTIPENFEKRISVWLEKMLKTLSDSGVELGANYWSTMSLEMVRRHLDLSCLALGIEALFEMRGVGGLGTTIKAASVILSNLSPVLSLKKWQPAERSHLVGALSPIFVPVADYPSVDYPVLLDPGAASGIPSNLIPEVLSTSRDVDWETSEFRFLRCLWKEARTQSVLKELAGALGEILRGSIGGAEKEPTQASQAASQRLRDQDDDFGEVKAASASSLRSGQGGAKEVRASSACVAVCVRGIISEAMAGSEQRSAVRIPALVELVTEVEGAQAIIIAEQVFNVVWNGIVELRLSEQEILLLHFGTVLLPDYRFARDERFALASLRLLECTAPTWIFAKVGEAAEDFGLKARELCLFFTDTLEAKRGLSWRVRVRLAAFFDTFLSLDRTQSMWAIPDIERPVYPTALLPTLLVDRDFRVRFRAATSSAQLFTLLHLNKKSDDGLFDDVRKYMPVKDVFNYELLLTQIICNANMFITSAYRRRSFYKLLLDFAGSHPEALPQIVAVLQGAAERLGLPDVKSLYMVYRRYYAHQQIRANYDPNHSTPFQACGFPSLQEMRNADLAAWGSTLLINDLDAQFVITSQIVKKDPMKCRLECFPDTVALGIANFIIDSERRGFPIEGLMMENRVGVFARGAGCQDDAEIETLVKSFADEILARLLALMYDDIWPVVERHPTLATDEKSAKTFHDILNLQAGLPIILAEASPPFFSSSTTVTAITWFNQRYSTLKTPAAVFSITRRLIAEVHLEPFIDLRRRLLVSLAMALALSTRVVHASIPILGSLSESLLLLLRQVDVEDLVVNMLNWCLKAWGNRLASDAGAVPEFCDFLLRAAHVCYSLISSPREGSLARSLMDLLDDQLRVATALDTTSSSTTTFLLWPGAIISLDALTKDKLTTALTSTSTPHSKISLVHSSRDREDLASATARSQVLWRLLEKMRPSDTISLEDCVALGDVLYGAEGEVTMPSLEELTDRKSLTTVIDQDTPIQQRIVTILLKALQHDDPELAHQAFTTLRRIFSTVESPQALYSSGSLSRQELDLAGLLAHPSLLRPDSQRRRETRKLEELADDGWLERSQTFPSWIRELAELLADCRASGESFFYAQLAPILRQSTEIAAQLVPSLVHSLLLRDLQKKTDDTSRRLSTYFQGVLQHTDVDFESTRTVVDVATFLRGCDTTRIKQAFSRFDRWLTIPWTILAQGAVTAKSYPTALLFLELAHEHNRLFDQGSRGNDERLAQSLLYEIYANVDEPDGFYGRQSVDARDALIRRYCHESRWSDAFGLYGSQFETSTLNPAAKSDRGAGIGIVQSLASFGFNRLAYSILQPARAKGNIREQDLDPGLPYELAWRTEVWDLPVESGAAGTSSVALYSALRAIHTSRDDGGLESAIDSLFLSEASKLANITIDLPTADMNAVSAVLALRELRRCATLDLAEPSVISQLSTLSPTFSFEHAERILSTRISYLRSVRTRELSGLVGNLQTAVGQHATDAEKACLLHLSEFARKAGRLQSAMNAVTLAHKLVEHDEGPTAFDKVNEELANVLWAQNEHATALTLLHTVEPDGPGSKALVLARLGEWTFEAKMKNAAEIRRDYFDPAIDILATGASPHEQAIVFGAYANFAHDEYQLCAKEAAAKVELKERFGQRSQSVLGEIARQLKSAGAADTLRSQLEKSKKSVNDDLAEDERLVNLAKEESRVLLWMALENFSKSLSASDDRDDMIFRFCSLWLANASDNELHVKLAPFIKAVPSHKYVFLTPQLSARLSSRSGTSSAFTKNIYTLVTRLCHDHPFHCLFSVHALRDTDNTPSPSSSRNRRSTGSTSSTTTMDLSSQKDRAQAAEDILAKIKKTALRPRIEHLELACLAYTEWANFELGSADQYLNSHGRLKGGTQTILSHFMIRAKLRDLPIPVSTLDIPLDPTGKYPPDSYPSIVRYHDTFTTAGGLHVPKIVVCVGSNGKGYKQLMKGGDDVRQDAGIEQTFTVANSLLKRDERTRRRRLNIRTYRVIPLQSMSGLIEFVDQTRSLNEILTDLYRVQEKVKDCIPIREARARLSRWEEKTIKQSDGAVEKEKAFPEVLKDFPPTMRHFFFEQHKLPSLWFDMRVNYSRSVAVTSIVGHIIGIGDRHCSNILMDTAQGDLVPIDFGISFGQGKRLRIPELVPFRLTQNIIDGMGTTGVDGIFRRCSEETLRVLRERSTVILTILQVFKHDPLQSWAISADLARRRQAQDAEDNENPAIVTEELPDEADRALATVAEKLDTKLSVDYTVNQLIQEATSVQNLGRIYSGWQPYL